MKKHEFLANQSAIILSGFIARCATEPSMDESIELAKKAMDLADVIYTATLDMNWT